MDISCTYHVKPVERKKCKNMKWVTYTVLLQQLFVVIYLFLPLNLKL